MPDTHFGSPKKRYFREEGGLKRFHPQEKSTDLGNYTSDRLRSISDENGGHFNIVEVTTSTMVRNFKENLGDTTSHASPDVQLHHATSGEPHGLKYGSVALDMCSRPPGIHVQETLCRDCHRDPKSSEGGVNSQDVHQIIHQLTPSKTGSSTVSKAGVFANQRHSRCSTESVDFHGLENLEQIRGCLGVDEGQFVQDNPDGDSGSFLEHQDKKETSTFIHYASVAIQHTRRMTWLVKYLQTIPPHQRIFPDCNSYTLYNLIRTRYPGYSAHSIKRGAARQLTLLIIQKKIPHNMLATMLKHSTNNPPIPEVTNGYIGDPIITAAILENGPITRLL